MAYDATLWWSGDLSSTPTGDIAVQSGSSQGQERILRRLLTNGGDYIWHDDYGGGLGLFVGSPLDRRRVEGVIRTQLSHESSVARSPAPSITTSAVNGNGVSVAIQYVDASDSMTQVLSFSMGN